MTLYAPTPSTDTQDAYLVGRAKAGEREAFDALVKKYQRRILKLTLRYTHDLCDAEDAAQETFIKAYRGLVQFRGECAFYTWLHRIAINSARTVLIARRRNPSTYADSLENEEAEAIPTRLQDAETPESVAQTDEIRQTVQAALSALTEVHRVAIMSREIDGMTYEEIALAMGTPVGTVRSRIFRAREIVDQRLRCVHSAGLGRLQ